MNAEKAHYSVVRMTRLRAVSRSGYHKWRSAEATGPSKAQQRRDQLDAKVKASHEDSDGIYGAPRILADLREDGVVVSRKTVAASMRRQGIVGISPRVFTPVTRVIDLDALRPKDPIDRRFDHVNSTGCGTRTSPTFEPVRAGCICAQSATAARGE